MTRLTELRDRVLAATGPDRTLDVAIANTLMDPKSPAPRYTLSLDAVVALCELKLPNVAITLQGQSSAGYSARLFWREQWFAMPDDTKPEATPALALLAALLTALAETTDAEGR